MTFNSGLASACTALLFMPAQLFAATAEVDIRASGKRVDASAP